MRRQVLMVFCGVALKATLGGIAVAASVPVTSTVINSSGACTSTSGSLCTENYQFAVNNGTITPVTAAPTTYTLGNTFNQSGSTFTASDFGVSAYNSATSPKCATPGTAGNCVNSSPFQTWNFQDNYEILTPASGPHVQGALVSFALPTGIGLSGLEARIVATNAPTASGLVGNAPLTVVDGWTNVTATQNGALTVYNAILSTTPLSGNTDYFLQVRGEAAAVAASYAGTFTFTPVPVPAAAWLLISGLGGLVLAGKKRKG